MRRAPPHSGESRMIYWSGDFSAVSKGCTCIDRLAHIACGDMAHAHLTGARRASRDGLILRSAFFLFYCFYILCSFRTIYFRCIRHYHLALQRSRRSTAITHELRMSHLEPFTIIRGFKITVCVISDSVFIIIYNTHFLYIFTLYSS